MSGHRLTLRRPLELRADLSGVLPSVLFPLRLHEVERLPVPYGTGRVPLAELFAVATAAHGVLEIEGDRRLDFVGAGLDGGTVRVTGDAGAFAGARLAGGTLLIEGAAGDGLAAGMGGGHVDVAGHAGAGAGGALPGERRGMAGGTVRIGGDAGPGAGARLRGGLLAIQGDAGPGLAERLIAGTLAVAGRVAGEPGIGMMRGTLILAAEPEAFGSGFGDTGEHDLVALRLMARRAPLLAELFGLMSGRTRRFVGDRLVGGQGEILVPL